jgi:single-stranded-DNA-specific exonuclease
MTGTSLPANIVRFLDRIDQVVTHIKQHKGKVRVISHYDGDGICAAGLMTKALMDAGISVHTTMIRDLDKNFVRTLAGEQNKLIVFCDMGSGQIDLLEQLDASIIVCDHHKPLRESKKIIQANPHFFGIDGTYEACGSTLSFLVAERMAERPEALFGVALAGMIADKQHLGGFSGINKILLEKYIANGAIKPEPSIQLEGENLLDSLKGSLEPFFKDISGRPDGAKALLAKAGIDPMTKLEDLHKEKFTALASLLILQLLRQGVRPGICEDFIIDRYYIESLQIYAQQLGAIINACGRRDEEDTGLAICLGSKDALKRGKELREEHRTSLRKAMLELEKDGPIARKNLQYFYCADPAQAGALAGLGMNYLFDQNMPTFSLSKVDNVIKVSTRGTRYLISKGLDLADACRRSAEHVKGQGGGHPIASGATIPSDGEDEFLSAADNIIGEQLKKKKGDQA